MLNEEEYKQTLIRMWDSVRKNDKGLESCNSVEINECPIHKEFHACNYCENIFFNFKLIQFVEEWGKLHPIETNAEHFKKSFGYEFDGACFRPKDIGCVGDNTCSKCRFYANSEYHAQAWVEKQ